MRRRLPCPPPNLNLIVATPTSDASQRHVALFSPWTLHPWRTCRAPFSSLNYHESCINIIFSEIIVKKSWTIRRTIQSIENISKISCFLSGIQDVANKHTISHEIKTFQLYIYMRQKRLKYVKLDNKKDKI